MKLPVVALASITMFAASTLAFVPAVRNGVARTFGLSSSAARSQSSLRMMAAPAEFVKQEIANNDVR